MDWSELTRSELTDLRLVLLKEELRIEGGEQTRTQRTAHYLYTRTHTAL